MTDFMKTMTASASGMTAQSSRLRLSAENIANVDTPGYRRKVMSFEQVSAIDSRMFDDDRVVRPGPVQLDQSELDRVYNPSHPLADGDGFYDGTNVDLMIEIADAREAQRTYEANLKLFEQAKRMTGSLIEMLRR